VLRRGGRTAAALSSSSSEFEPVVDSEDDDEDEDAEEVVVSESESVSLMSLALSALLDAEPPPPARRCCSKTPRPRFICMIRSSVSSICSMSMLCGSCWSSSSFDCSICGRNCWMRASSSVGGSVANVLRSPKSNVSCGGGSLVGPAPSNLSRIFSVGPDFFFQVQKL